MLITTDGIVIRERFVGENDKYIDILTRELGVIEISVKGAKKIISKNSGSTQLFCYSKFCFSQRGERYYMNSSEPIRSFYNIRLDIDKYALASYFSEIIKSCVMPLDTAETVLRLYLNSLHFLETGNREISMLKSIFELRVLVEIGLMPDIIGCIRCKQYENDCVYFNCADGYFICSNCLDESDNLAKFILLNKTELHIVRHIILSDFDKLFNFRTSQKVLKIIAKLTQDYLLIHLNRRFKTLEFYNSLQVVEN